MKPDRPLIVSILFLARGLALIFGYAKGIAGLSAAYPISSSALHIDVNTTGLAALGGIALLGVGILLLVWALLAALVSQVMHLGGWEPERRLRNRREDTEEDEAVGRLITTAPRASFLGLDSAAPWVRNTEFEQENYRPS